MIPVIIVAFLWLSTAVSWGVWNFFPSVFTENIATIITAYAVIITAIVAVAEYVCD